MKHKVTAESHLKKPLSKRATFLANFRKPKTLSSSHTGLQRFSKKLTVSFFVAEKSD